jgi:arylsulfatase A-like enzyme
MRLPYPFLIRWPSLLVTLATAVTVALTYLLDIVSTAIGLGWHALAGQPVASAPPLSQFRTFQRRLGESRRRRRHRRAAYALFGSPALA